MRIEQRGLGVVGAGGLLALIALAYACGPSTTRPETVLSGNPGVGGGGGSTAASEPDAGSDDDSGGGTAVDGGVNFTCYNANIGTCAVYVDVSASLEASMCASPLVAAATCPAPTTPDGCCTVGGAETCYYTPNTSGLATSDGCKAGGGTWTATQQ
jgi:hypothetical protein